MTTDIVKKLQNARRWNWDGAEAANEIEKLHKALRQIARGDYNDWASCPAKWASSIAYKALGGRHKDGVALDPELLGQLRSETIETDLPELKD